MSEDVFMRAMGRCYLDAVTKPHIDADDDENGTYKFDIRSEGDIEEAVEGFEQFVREKFEEWQLVHEVDA